MYYWYFILISNNNIMIYFSVQYSRWKFNVATHYHCVTLLVVFFNITTIVCKNPFRSSCEQVLCKIQHSWALIWTRFWPIVQRQCSFMKTQKIDRSGFDTCFRKVMEIPNHIKIPICPELEEFGRWMTRGNVQFAWRSFSLPRGRENLTKRKRA